MELHLVLSRSYDEEWSPTTSFNISRISCYSESDEDEWSTVDLYPQPFPKNIDVDCVVCSGNGLLCFLCLDQVDKDVQDDDYVIWNSSTNAVKLIPRPDSMYLPCACSSRRCSRQIVSFGYGIGFVAESPHDYKFVRFMHYSNNVRDGCIHNRSFHVAVYSSKNNSWKELPFPVNFQNSYSFRPVEHAATCVNGFCYWTTSANVILSFDLSTDSFSTLPYPDHIVPENDSNTDSDLFVLELDGSLVLVSMVPLDKKAITSKYLFSFWVKESSSISSPWTRKINLDVCLAAEKPLWLGRKKNNSLVLLLQGDGPLLEYNYSTRELKKIDQIHDHHSSSMIMSPIIFPNVETNIADDDGDGVDRISRLPDDIILSILSLLSFKEAASTSIISTRWSNLWRHAPNLKFHDTHLKKYKSKYINWVDSVVGSHKALSLKEFNISFPLNYSSRRTVMKWLGFAFSRRVEVLELNLFRSSFAIIQRFLEKSGILKSTHLTSLCLKCLKVSGEGIGLFLRNCPLLERLIIKYAVLTSDLEICGGALKHLDIQYCIGGISIKRYAPKLTYLKINSDSSPFINANVDTPKLVWATPQFADDPPLFCLISPQLTTLEFTLHCSKGFLEKGFPQIPSLRELIVAYHEDNISPTTSLLCALPYLEEFEIKHSRIKIAEEATNNVERFCHRHLRVFKFTCFDGFDVSDGDHMELMSYILDNCIALQKIILHIYDDDSPSPSYVAARKYAKQLQSKLPTHIQLIIRFNYHQLV